MTSMSVSVPAMASEHGVYILNDGTLFDAAYYESTYPEIANGEDLDDATLVNYYEQYGKAAGQTATYDESADVSSLIMAALPESAATGEETLHIYQLENGIYFDADYYRSLHPVETSGKTDLEVILDYENIGMENGELPADPDMSELVLALNAEPMPVSAVDSVDALEADGFFTAGSYEMGEDVEQALESAVSEIEAEGYDVSFAMVDLTTGQSVSYNIDERYYSASSIKGPYVVSLVRQNPAVLTSDYSTIASILTYSDNDAYKSLWSAYGMDCLSSLWSDAGNGSFAEAKTYGGGYMHYTPRQLVKLWIACEDYFENGEKGTELGKMFEIPYYSCLHRVLGGAYTTRTKGGWYPTKAYIYSSCDAGIIYAGDHPYAVAIMSNIPGVLEKLDGLALAIDQSHNEMVSSMN